MLTTRKKKLARLACRAALGSRGSVVDEAFWGRRIGVALNCLISYRRSSVRAETEAHCQTEGIRYPFEGLVVGEAGGIFGDVKLSFLQVFTKFPMSQNCGQASGDLDSTVYGCVHPCGVFSLFLKGSTSSPGSRRQEAIKSKRMIVR